MNDALKAMGQKIYAARKAAKMSRAELGRLVDLHETTVKRYEDGDIKSPNLSNLRSFANALKIPTSPPTISEAKSPAIAITPIGISLITVAEIWNFDEMIGEM